METLETLAEIVAKLDDLQTLPFDNGNESMAKLLMDLMKYAYPPAIIPTEQRKDYINALSEADKTDNLEPFAIYVGKCLIHSLKLMLKTAKKECTEEPDDFDKKIALLQAKMKETNTIEKYKTNDTVANIINNILTPNIQHKIVEAKIDKLASLFLKKNLIFHANTPLETSNFLNLDWQMKIWNMFNENNPYTYDKVHYIFKLKDFKKVGINTFDLEGSVNVFFYAAKYNIAYSVADNLPKNIEKLYHQIPTEAEWKLIADTIGNDLLAEIEKKIV